MHKHELTPSTSHLTRLLSDASRRQLSLNSVAAQKLLFDIKEANYDEKFIDRYWRTGAVYMVESEVLLKRYEAYVLDQRKMVYRL